MTYPRVYAGRIEDVLRAGEYDQGDLVQIEYDELFDLVEQCRIIRSELSLYLTGDEEGSIKKYVEHRSNRPLHPVLGGNSPYTGFLPL